MNIKKVRTIVIILDIFIILIMLFQLLMGDFHLKEFLFLCLLNAFLFYYTRIRNTDPK